MFSKQITKFFQFESIEKDELLKRVTLIQITILTCFFGVLYSIIMMMLFDLTDMSDIVLIYITGSFLNVLTYKIFNNFDVFRIVQLLFISFMPVLTQIYIGGFTASSAVGISAFIAPLGALFFYSPKVSRVFFFVFIFFISFASFLESEQLLRENFISKDLILLFFLIVICLTFSVIYFITEYYVIQQNKRIEDLKHENEKLQRKIDWLQRTNSY